MFIVEQNLVGISAVLLAMLNRQIHDVPSVLFAFSALMLLVGWQEGHPGFTFLAPAHPGGPKHIPEEQ